MAIPRDMDSPAYDRISGLCAVETVDDPKTSKLSAKGLSAKALWQIAVERIIYVDAFQEVVGCFSRSNFISKYPI